MLPLKTFLTVLSQYCAERQIGWCYARLYTDEAFQTPQRDVDIIAEKRHVSSLIQMIQAWPNIKLVGVIEHPTNTQLYIHGIKQEKNTFFCLDIHHALAFKGIDYLKPSAVILKSVPAECGIGQQAEPMDMALIYLFTHVLKHKTVPASAIAAMNAAYYADRLGFEDLLDVYFGDDASRYVHAISDNKEVKASSLILCKRFQRRTRHQDMLAYSVNKASYYIETAFQRIFKRQDVRIVVLGTDGSGKTHLIHSLKPHVAFLRPRVVHAHLKPVFPWQSHPDSNRVNSQPHAKPNRSWLMSNIKLCYFFFLYWFDAVWPYRGSRVMLYDRYYIDLLVDPRRYRFGGSPTLATFFFRHLPHIHVYIGMSTPPIIAYKRKPELNLLLVQKQYESYQQLTEIHPNAMSLDGTHLTEDALQECVSFIAQTLEKKAR